MKFSEEEGARELVTNLWDLETGIHLGGNSWV